MEPGSGTVIRRQWMFVLVALLFRLAKVHFCVLICHDTRYEIAIPSFFEFVRQENSRRNAKEENKKPESVSGEDIVSALLWICLKAQDMNEQNPEFGLEQQGSRSSQPVDPDRVSGYQASDTYQSRVAY